MKENWERTEQPLELSLEELNHVAGPAFQGRSITSARRIGVGLSNSNYKIQVEGDGRPYVLRFFRRGEDIADKEIALTRLVRERVPVAEFVYADTSRSRYPKPWAVLEREPGVLLSDIFRSGTPEEKASAAAAAGRTLARIHGFPFEASGFFGSDLMVTQPFSMSGDRFLAFMEDVIFHSPCEAWLGEALTRQLWAFCKRYGPLLSASQEKPVLAHSDYNGLNLLWREVRNGTSFRPCSTGKKLLPGTGMRIWGTCCVTKRTVRGLNSTSFKHTRRREWCWKRIGDFCPVWRIWSLYAIC